MKTFLLMALCCGPALASEGMPLDRIATTELFSFHDNPWINEHHFLYHVAKHDEDERVLAGLEDEERDQLLGAIRYYREQLIDRDLMFNGELFRLKLWLVQQPLHGNLPDHEELRGTIRWLNRVRPLFDRQFRPQQEKRNLATVERHLQTIRKHEAELAARLAKLSRTGWSAEPIRVDVSYYTNWAGAYTTTRPRMHIVIRSEDDGPPGDWVETLFHEASHGLIGARRGPISETIASVSEQLGVEVPDGLWHAILFYIAGRVVQDRLEADSGEDYPLYMVREAVYDDYYPLLVERFEPYVAGEIDLETGIRRVIEGLDGG